MRTGRPIGTSAGTSVWVDYVGSPTLWAARASGVLGAGPSGRHWAVSVVRDILVCSDIRGTAVAART